MVTRHERARRDDTTCDDIRPATLAATLTCARCAVAAGGNGLCADHSRKRRAMIRNGWSRYLALLGHAEHLVTVAGRGECHDDDDLALPVSVSLREVL